MKFLSHFEKPDKPLLKDLNEDWPFQFLPEYASFLNEELKEKILIAYEPSLNAYMPIRIFKSLTFTFGQILHAPVSKAEELKQKDQLLFFNLLMMQLRKGNICDRLVQPHPYGILSALPPNTRYCEFGTYITDLSRLNTQEIFSSMNDKYQKAIKHALKHKAVVKTGWQYFDSFYPLLQESLKKVNFPVEPASYFMNLRKHLGESFSTVAIVYDDNTPVGGAFYLYSRYAAYCTHAGNTSKTKLYGAMKLLHYEMMLHFKSLKVKRYDLVGVRLQNNNPSLEGIFKFKKGFGGELKTGFLWKADIHSGRLKIFDFIQKLRGHSNKTIDIIDQQN